MYLEFYGLEEKPFNLTPDVHFLFPSRVHREALSHLMFGIEGRRGFILLSGEVGAGKTTICRALLKEIGSDTEVALILNTFLNELELLKSINEDLGIRTTGKTKKELIGELNEFLLESRKSDKNVAIVIDEAQNLSLPVLEEIRMLGNLETEKEKLVQIILVGQPEIRRTLASSELKQLNQRISVRYHLRALNRAEVEHYIYHRLRVAGSRGDVIFTKKALNKIYKYTGGIPRMVNVICDQSLLIGYVESTKNITPQIVNRAFKEVFDSGGYSKAGLPLYSKLRTALKVAAVIALLVGFALMAKLMLVNDQFGFFDSSSSGPVKSEAEPQEAAAARVKPPRKEQESTTIDNPRLKKMAASVPSLLLTAIDVHKTGYLGTSVALASTDVPAANTVSSEKNSSLPVKNLLRIWNIAPNKLKEAMKAIGGDFKPETDLLNIYQLAEMGSVQSVCDVPFLLKVNTPAVIRIEDAGSAQYALLQSAAPDRVLLHTAEQEIITDLKNLEEIFTGEAIFVASDTFINPRILHDKLNLSLEVRRLQELLKKHGVFAGNLNGWFTQETKTAVIDFQKAQKLTPTGVVDVNTKLMLYFLLPEINVPRLR